MLEFYVLASGSKGNAILVYNGQHYLQIDCGMTKKYLLASYKQLHISLNDISALLITHRHSDHIAQIKTFKHHDIYSLCNLEDKCEATKIIPYKKNNIAGFEVIALPLSHDSLDTIGFVIKSGGKKLVYITDTGYVKEAYLPLLDSADYIILEANHDLPLLMKSKRPLYLKQRIASDTGHLCNQASADILEKIVGKQTRLVCLAHLSEECNKPEIALSTVVSKLSKQPLKDLRVVVLQQNRVFYGGENEELNLGINSDAFYMEYFD